MWPPRPAVCALVFVDGHTQACLGLTAKVVEPERGRHKTAGQMYRRKCTRTLLRALQSDNARDNNNVDCLDNGKLNQDNLGTIEMMKMSRAYISILISHTFTR